MNDPLEGKFFHFIDGNNNLKHQGKIISQLPDNHYLIEFYGWISGEKLYERIWCFESKFNCFPIRINKI